VVFQTDTKVIAVPQILLKTGKLWHDKGSTELYCLFIAAGSVVDAISFIRCIVLWPQDKFSPNSDPAGFEFVPGESIQVQLWTDLKWSNLVQRYLTWKEQDFNELRTEPSIATRMKDEWRWHHHQWYQQPAAEKSRRQSRDSFSWTSNANWVMINVQK